MSLRPASLSVLFQVKGILSLAALCAMMISKSVLADGPNLSMDQVILSPPGWTELEWLIEKSGGTLPYPFSKIASLGAYSFIPDGRSLQKKNASFSDPRVVVAVSDKLFLGYAPRSKQIEAITWNPIEGRYDFYIVTNYGKGLKPQLIRPERSKCIACHQGEAPIWTRNGWLESSNISTDDEINRKIAKALSLEEFEGLRNRGQGDPVPPSAIDAAVRGANQLLQARTACTAVCRNNLKCRMLVLKAALYRMSDRVPDSLANELEQELQKNWHADGFAHISSALPNRDPLRNPAQGGTAYIEVIENEKALGNLYKKQKHTSRPTDAAGHPIGKPIIEELFPAGDPTDENSVAHEILASAPTAPRYGSAINMTYNLERFSPAGGPFPVATLGNQVADFKTVAIPAGPGSLADPLVPRPKVDALTPRSASTGLFSMNCLGLDFNFDRETLQLDKEDHLKQMVAALDTTEGLKIVEKWPLDRAELVPMLLQLVGEKQIPACYMPTKASSPMSIIIEESSKIAQDASQQALQEHRNDETKALQFLQKYCARCHTDDSVGYPLPLKSIDGMKNYQKKTLSSPIYKLEHEIMPPRRDSLGDKEKGELEFLEKYLKN